MENKKKMHIPKHLVERMMQLDETVLNELHKIISPYAIAFVVDNNGSKDHGKEVANKVLNTLWEIFQKGNYNEQGQIEPFVWRIIKNIWFQYLRQSKNKRNHESLDEYSNFIDKISKSDNFEAEIAQNKINEILYIAISKLGKPCQNMLEKWSENVSEKEIANEMGIKYGTLRVQIMRCKQSLKEEFMKLLGREGDDYMDYFWNG